MGVADTIDGLSRFPARGAGTNAERRAAVWLAGQLRSARREATVETFWSRPNWAVANAWHAALAAAGSLLTVASPKAGGGVIIAALIAIVVDALIGVSPGRRLTREHASQNVVSPAPPNAPPVRLILTANYDAGRMGLVHQPFVRRPTARLRQLLGPLALGWQASLGSACLWVLAIAALRDGGAKGSTVAVLQLIPTAGLVLGAALLLDLGSSSFGPAAGDNATGSALAVALTRALDVTPPRRLGVEVVLQGASDGSMLGLRRHLRARRHELDAGRVIVLGLAACGGGRPAWWTSDGPLLPARLHPRLAQLVATVIRSGPPTSDAMGTDLTRPGADGGHRARAGAAHRGRGTSPAYPARLRGLPALTIGALDTTGLPPRSHLPTDTPAQVDTTTADRLLELALTLIDAIDAAVPAAAPMPAPSTEPGRSAASA
ncbi:MAG: hypothetical protein QOF83_1887 [Solirubrobacteraceae bacterium]|jgi:hypothetical protein|nr:hypothetical protein [Solirubrobacteraceae bacterium]